MKANLRQLLHQADRAVVAYLEDQVRHIFGQQINIVKHYHI